MFKFKQGKNLILILLCIMFIALASFSCVYAVAVHYQKQNESQAASCEIAMDVFWRGYYDTNNNGSYDSGETKLGDWKSGLLDDGDTYDHSDREEEYENFSVFTIKDYTELDQFRQLVCDGFDFQEKNVKLIGDPDGTGHNWTAIGGGKLFKGRFYGQNHTIKNLTTTDDSSYYGIFGKIQDAEIHDLRVSNFKININSPVPDVYCGALAGMVDYNCIINNCIVEDFSLSTSWTVSGGWYVSGLVGCTNKSNENNTTTISNCYVDSINITYPSVSDQTLTQIYVSGIIGVEYFVNLSYKGTLSIYDCFVGEIVNSGTTTGSVLTYRYNKFYATASDASLCTINGNYGVLDGNYWYVPPTTEYNNGWPYLKSYIKFTTWTFNDLVLSGLNGSSSLKIEAPNTLDSYLRAKIQGPLFEFYGALINISGNETYEFDKWLNYTGNTTFTVQYKYRLYTVTLAPTSGDKQVSASLLSFEVYYQQTITVKTVYEENIKQKNIHVYVDGLWKAYYPLVGDNSAYYLLVEETYVITTNTTISPIIKFKEYNVGLG